MASTFWIVLQISRTARFYCILLVTDLIIFSIHYFSEYMKEPGKTNSLRSLKGGI